MENKYQLSTLKNSSDFMNLKDRGRKVFPNHWLIINYMKNDQTSMRVGWTVPRATGNAVLRNKLKRWTREVFRKLEFKGIKQSCDFNIVFRVKKDDFYKNLKFYEFEESIKKVIKRIN